MLSSTPYSKYPRMNRGPFLTPHHVSRRKVGATSHVKGNEDNWASVIWSSEKKFNFDGPDKYARYWHDLRTEKGMFSKLQNG